MILKLKTLKAIIEIACLNMLGKLFDPLLLLYPLPANGN